MNHDDAVREQAVERYLLDELSADARTRFEEHYFDCPICSSELKSGAGFVDALKLDPSVFGSPQRGLRVVPRRSPATWLRPWLAPALAASLLVIAYQNLLVLPAAHRAVGANQAPAIVNNVVLANIDARGSEVQQLTAPAHGSFLLSVDIPTKAEYSSYLCALHDLSGKQLWQLPITAQQAENTVALQVPTDKAINGQNELRLLGIPSTGGSPVELGRYRFSLHIAQ